MMRHDKLRQWADDVTRTHGNGDEETIIPHQSIADKIEPDPKLKQPNESVPAPDDENDEDITDGYPDEYDNLSQEEEQRQDEQEDGYSEIEEKAMAMGWVPKEKWHGDPDDWTSAKRFVQTGEMIQANRTLHQKIDYMENDFNARLQNQQRLHEAQLKMTLDNLRKERAEAVELADTDKFNQLDEQIRTLEQSAPPGSEVMSPAPSTPAPQNTSGVNEQVLYQNLVNHPIVQQWREKNPWIEQQSPKTAYAEREFVQWVQQNINNPNATLEQGLSHIDRLVAQQFSNQAPQRQRPSMSEKRGGPSRRSAPRLGMADLTREEKLIWETMGKSWKNQNEFLQSVRDTREAKRKNQHD